MLVRSLQTTAENSQGTVQTWRGAADEAHINTCSGANLT